MTLRVTYEEQALNQAAGFLADDPAGVSAAMDAVDLLGEDPRPAASVPWGSPDLRRLHAGRYRVIYRIAGDVVSVWHIGRLAR